MKHLSKHLNFASIVSCIALFVALGGATYAATTLPRKSVKTRNLANGAVTTLKLRGGAVTTLKLRNGAVTAAKIAPGAVGTTQIADGSVRSVDLGGGVVTASKLKNGAVTGEKIAANAVGSNELSANAVATGKIQEGAVTSTKLAPSLFGQLVKGVSYVVATSPSNEEDKPKSVTAACPAGKQVTGGGARIVGAEVTTVAVTESTAFVSADGRRTGWTATADAIAPETKPWAVEATAVCAEF